MRNEPSFFQLVVYAFLGLFSMYVWILFLFLL